MSKKIKEIKKKLNYHKKRVKFYKEKLNKAEADKYRIGFIFYD